MSEVLKNFPFAQIVVIGGTGQTGHRILERLVQYADVRLVGTSRAVSSELPAGSLASTVLGDAQKWGAKVLWQPLDLESDPGSVHRQLARIGGDLNTDIPTALVFAAAFTNVEACESDPEKCERINETNTIEVLKWARNEFNAKLVFYSTDYLFDGLAGPYAEVAKKNATSKYGQSKLLVEEWLEKHAADSLILRTTGVYDYLPGSKNFLMQMLELWGQGKTTRIPSDQYANPTWAHDLARATIALLEHGSKGVFNIGGGEYLARTDFAKTIARIFGFDAALISPILTEEMGQKAKRPLKGGLTSDKLQSELGWSPGAAKDVLAQLKWLHHV